MEGASLHSIAAIHLDSTFLLVLAVSLQTRRIALIPSSSRQELDVLLCDLHLEPEILVIDSRIEGVCPYAAELLDRWPRLSAIVIISDHHTCNDCQRLLRVSADETNLVEKLSTMIQEIAVTKPVQAKVTQNPKTEPSER